MTHQPSTQAPGPDGSTPNGTDPMVPPTSRTLRRAKAKGVLAGIVGVAAIGTASVVGINAATAADTPTPVPSGSSTSTPPATNAPAAPETDTDRPGPGGPGRGGHGGFGALGGSSADLAEKLGVTEEALQDAMTTVRDELRPGDSADGATKPTAGERPDPTAMQEKLSAALAKALDLDAAKVTAALEEVRTEAEADRSAAFQDRLDQAVQDGTLTQAEADAVLKAEKAGVIGTGGRGPGGPGPR